MAITDEEVIRFANEQVRPKCEEMRNLYYELKALTTYWTDTLSPLIPNEAENMVEDGRAEVTQLSGADVVGFIMQGAAFITAMEETGVLSTIQKPCVRHLRVE